MREHSDIENASKSGVQRPPGPVAPATPIPGARAWRSIERYRELKELRKHLADITHDLDGDQPDLHI